MSWVRFSRRAARDLEDILLFAAGEGGAELAELSFASFMRAVRRLADSPWNGHRREDLTRHPVRIYAVQRWLVVYRPEPSPPEIVRIVHAARGPVVLREFQLERRPARDAPDGDPRGG